MAVSPNTVTSADVQNFIIGGGGGGTTTDMWLWNATGGSGNDVLPE